MHQRDIHENHLTFTIYFNILIIVANKSIQMMLDKYSWNKKS